MSKHPSSTVRRLQGAAEDLAATQRDTDMVIARMRDSIEGHPAAQNYDPGGGGDGTSSTERIGTRLAEYGDRARADLAAVDRLTRRIAADAQVLRRIMDSHRPHHASDKDRREAERVNSPETECAHCRAHGDKHEPSRTTTDVGGILPVPVPLCRWHADFTARQSRPASTSETDRHHQGRTIRLPA